MRGIICRTTGAAFLALAVMLAIGCATPPAKFDPSITAPQLLVDPPVIRTGIARLLNDTPLMFKGKGFKPGDSVFITLMDVMKDGESTDVPIAEAVVEDNGEFETEVTKLVKVTELLMADLELNDEMEMYVVVSQPPIAEGTYTVAAQSMESERTAECSLTIQDPSLGDSFKDWVGGLLGKIEKK